VALKEQKVGEDRYSVEVTPPHGDRPWLTDQPSSKESVERELEALNCHPRDIWDALDEADRFGSSG